MSADFNQIDSAFQLGEHLKALHNSFAHPDPENTLYTIPLTLEQCHVLSQPPVGIDKNIWLYELARFHVNHLNKLIVGLINARPQCSAETCPEMRASEWQYLCAVHQPPKPCCAFDYCTHTLDWATNSLTSPKEFPSRMSLTHDPSSDSSPQVKTITNIMRRIYRIFAHAWFSHRGVFWKVEHKTGLYLFFKTVCDAYVLIPDDNYTIPPEAEGREAEVPEEAPDSPQQAIPKSVSKKSTPAVLESPSTSTSTLNTPSVAGATARRHRHTPSKGIPVDTVPEEEDEDEEAADDMSEDTVIHDDLPAQPSPIRRDTQVRIDTSTETVDGDPGPGPAYSPASPKAATREEVEEMKAEEAAEEAAEKEPDVTIDAQDDKKE